MKKSHVLIVTSILMLSSCASLDKMIDHGNFDAAVSKSLKKMSGKSKLKDKHVLALEEAFSKATNRDIQSVKSLHDSEHASDWAQSIRIYERILKRQNAIAPLLPIVAKNGYRANFQFAQVDGLRKAAIDKYLDLVYTDVVEQMILARRGNKAAARRAYREIDKLDRYDKDYRNATLLKLEARKLGIAHVGVTLTNRMHFPVAQSMRRDLLRRSFPDKKWTKFHLQEHSMPKLDFKMDVVLEHITFSPERLSEQLYRDEREIEAGFEYVLDDRGNVKKDSAGNDIKIPLYKVIYADVVKVHQHKAATVEGHVRVIDISSGEVDLFPIASNIVFEHVGATFAGDRRALSTATKALLEAPPVPFPTEEVLLADALAGLNDVIRKDVMHSISM